MVPVHAAALVDREPLLNIVHKVSTVNRSIVYCSIVHPSMVDIT